MVTVREVFAAAGLQPCGPVRWQEPVSEARPGVYVVALTSSCDEVSTATTADVALDAACANERARWIADEPVLYIGRTKRALRRRLSEFYAHRYGARRPHRGGQAVIGVTLNRWVYWAPTRDWALAEEAMIDHFRREVGSLPFANRIRSARPAGPASPNLKFLSGF